MSQYNEPWSIDPLYLFIMDKNGEKIEFCGSEENEEKLDRMVAAVNATQNFSTEELERLSNHVVATLSKREERATLRCEIDAYRDLCGDLIKQLKSINENMAGVSEYGGFYYNTQLLIIKAETVIGNKS